ncbi:hypothetical protein ASPWEDRAFT_54163 [Aspergillus wentii DTO 134E9]|uniref:Uncharacterized protein n=1 Tax=Aspergillus wentii DTO 134E9 TaxID=1073089 RepID=A0A1L9R7B4_ASPWE|nr:uncharacterized protein ASPWEDRAFT_54163 [Aspergillus wentii DTO 134E9]OJJ30777.1 hypothetical protein ASPWEDRAFT_54163 [Aspergillus wentii DTO 134E9]
MHLDHKIPWTTASSHFSLIHNNPKFTPHRTGLFPRNRPAQSNDLNHFIRVVVATIREFSNTQRSKATSTTSVSGKLFSDTLLFYPERKYGLGEYETSSALHNPLSEKHQHVEYWIERAGGSERPVEELGYSSGDGDLSDAVKMLVILAANTDKDDESREVAIEAFSVLLTLSRHPKVPLHQLKAIHWGHAFGVGLVGDFALDAYLLLNLVDAVLSRSRIENTLKKEVSILEMDSFRHFANNALPDYDYPTQNVPHRAFWNPLGVTDGWAYEQIEAVDPLTCEDPDVLGKLKEYLKLCFALVYVYDALLVEWHGEEEADAHWKEVMTINQNCWSLFSEMSYHI